MKSLIAMMFMTISFVVFGQEAEQSSFDKFMGEWGWVAMMLMMIWEYLVGISKLKSNSTIELFLGFLKGIIPGKHKK